MKKSNSLDKVEKTVLVIAVLLIPITIGLGVFKIQHRKRNHMFL